MWQQQQLTTTTSLSETFLNREKGLMQISSQPLIWLVVCEFSKEERAEKMCEMCERKQMKPLNNTECKKEKV